MANCLIWFLIFGEAACLVWGAEAAEGGEDPLEVVRRNDFFRRIAANPPRIGRRNDFFFAKNLKSVPRIGKKNDFFSKAVKTVPRIGRRDAPAWMDTEAVAAWPWFRDDFTYGVKRHPGQGMFHGEEEFLRPLDLVGELEEPRMQALH